MLGMVENFKTDLVWDTMHAGCNAFLGDELKLESQARKMAEAETLDDPLLRGEAAFEFFYGDEEDNKRYRMKRDSDESLGLMDFVDLVCEIVQQHYFLNHFREELKQEKKRQKREAKSKTVKRQAVAAGLFSLADDDGGDTDDVLPYEPYIAEIAYFFPFLEVFIPFDGSFKFLNQRYDPFNLNK